MPTPIECQCMITKSDSHCQKGFVLTKIFLCWNRVKKNKSEMHFGVINGVVKRVHTELFFFLQGQLGRDIKQ